MALLVILMFLATPFIEIALFIKVGGWIGALPTIGLTILTSAVGLAIVRGQGLANLMKMQKTLAQHEMPITGMFHAMMLALAGLLLIIPGFFTDFLGIILLVPPIRSALGRGLMSRMQVTMQTSGHPGAHNWSDRQSGVVDAEFWEESDNQASHTRHRLPPQAND